MEDDKFLETFESLIKTIKDLIVKPVKRFTGFASLGLLLIVLLLTALVFLFMGVLMLLNLILTHLQIQMMVHVLQ